MFKNAVSLIERSEKIRRSPPPWQRAGLESSIDISATARRPVQDQMIGQVAKPVELTAHNGLVGGSSPPGPTTHSLELGTFPICAKRPRTGGLCRRRSGLCRDQFRRGGDFDRVVSGLEIRLPG